MTTPARNYSIDTLRTIATLLVVILHISATYVSGNIEPRNFGIDFRIGNIIDSFCRVSVPLFVMISGRFLLGLQEPTELFYKKRATRILIPLIFWSLVYSVFTLATTYQAEGFWDIRGLAGGFIKGKPFHHLWYLYMIIGLYAVTPFINMVLPKIGKRKLWAAAWILIIFGIVNSYYDFFFHNTTFFLVWFVNYLGYYLLGYLLKDSKSRNKWLLFGGYVICSLLIAVLSHFTATRYGNLPFYLYLSPFVILGSVCLYKLFDQLTLKANVLSRISKYSFGIYLIHAGILFLMVEMDSPLLERAATGFPIKFVVVTGVSLVLSWIISKIKYLRKVI